MSAMFVPRSVKRKGNEKERSVKRNYSMKGHLQPRKEEMKDEGESSSSNHWKGTEETPVHVVSNEMTTLPCKANLVDSWGDSDEGEDVVSYSKNQRWPRTGEPVCVACGRYGAYIVDETDCDVCSLECKAKHLRDIAKKNQEEALEVNSSDAHHMGQSRSKNTTMATHHVITNASPVKASVDMSSQENGFNFQYVEHPSIAELSSIKVEHILTNLNIQVKGGKIERPILEFQHCQLGTTLSTNLANYGYHTPTPVQMQVIPVALSMRDVLACAQTGSGKTAAFLLPMIHIIHLEIDWLFKNRRSFHMHRPRGLIMAPTRELCIQIEKQAKELMQGLANMKTALLVGGLPLPPQLHRLRSGVQIIVATPGRMLEVLAKSGAELSFVKIFVLDEVDTMLQMGFEHQVRQVIEKLPQEKQTLMFSATIPSSIESMAAKFLVNPVYISVGLPSAPNTAVKQIILWVEDKTKKKRLFSILQDTKYFRPPVVVFVDSKMGADLLAEAIQKICNLSCLSMHGDKSQSERSRILEAFLAGECPVIVCTALLGRGIDLPNISQVINFDMPSSVEEYVHQVGRAGRLGKSGWALTFVNNTNKAVFLDLVETLQPLGVNLPEELLNSPYLHQQMQHSKVLGQKRKHRDIVVTQENLMDLLEKSSMRRRK